MKPTVYIETSVISYLTARPSRDLIVAAHQQLTRDWWELTLPKFDAFISAIVVEEASKGDAQAAQLRLEKTSSFPLANGNVKKIVDEINADYGIRSPIICTPEELLEV